MIEVKNLTKLYETRTVLDDISVTFPQGQIVSLIGPSGGGKSTLMRCLNGLEAFHKGTITVGTHTLQPGGEKANKKEIFEIRQRVGMVFQQWHLFAHRTAVGNVIEAPITVKHEPIAQATERAKALLAKVGLSHRENAYPHEMSGGEQQRVAIARALAMNPEALLLDEPTSALDPERVGDVMELLQKLCEENKLTMLIVTHEMKFARELSHRILVLHGGKIIEDGPPAAVLDTPTNERTRQFLGMD